MRPEAVQSLADDHPAILEGRPLFPTTVVTAGQGSNVLVSGVNNKKIGKVVTKGAFKGYAIYVLTLAERETCPTHCGLYKSCYGNAMPFAIRHRAGIELVTALDAQLAELMAEHPKGVLVRLHGLGDFYSVAYVRFWESMLNLYPRLAVYGYTAHAIKGPEEETTQICLALATMVRRHKERAMIRLSGQPGPMGAMVIIRKPEGSRVEEGVVCPAERDVTACCATCGLCWSPEFVDETIVFVRHGMGARKVDAIRDKLAATENSLRPVRPVAELSKLAAPPRNQAPRMIWVNPESLLVDETYQRTLSRNSMTLIAKIVRGWDWSRFNAPVVCEAPEGLYLINGQHTAIAAATHPDITMIPVMVVDAESVKDRAHAFLGHNRDRISLTALQIHKSAVVAGDTEAIEVSALCERAGVTILAVPPVNGTYQSGQTVALGSIKALLKRRGQGRAVRVLQILAAAECQPIRADQIKALDAAIDVDPEAPDALWIETLQTPYETTAREARELSGATGEPGWRSMATVYLTRSRAVSVSELADEDDPEAPAEASSDLVAA